jgi:hypothetical protein
MPDKSFVKIFSHSHVNKVMIKTFKCVNSEHNFVKIFSTEGRTRTGTRCEPHWILSPARLPIPPLRLINICYIFHMANTSINISFFRLLLEVRSEKLDCRGWFVKKNPTYEWDSYLFYVTV